jgi:hypothetical protein
VTGQVRDHEYLTIAAVNTAGRVLHQGAVQFPCGIIERDCGHYLSSFRCCPRARPGLTEYRGEAVVELARDVEDALAELVFGPGDRREIRAGVVALGDSF